MHYDMTNLTTMSMTYIPRHALKKDIIKNSFLLVLDRHTLKLLSQDLTRLKT